ncbi:MAG: c-type cytochrome [Kangiellaceae bacterium]|jgi:cytochrome c553|nr:c-type cytochrome [Kangiellaceae bacterium]
MKKSAVLVAIVGLATTFANFAVAAGDAAEGQKKSTVCAACHGADGNTSATPDTPKLAGQGEKYLTKQLMDFKSGARANAIMAGQVAALSEQDMMDLAAYYASLEVQYSAVEDKYIDAGQTLYRAGDRDAGIPACTACHGPAGNGVDSAGFASLGGQGPAYTIAQLKAFRSGARGNDMNRMMRDIAAKLSDEQIETIAYYLAGLH